MPTRRAANVVWERVRLADVLQEARIAPGAAFAWADRVDHGIYRGADVPCFLKDLPLSRVPEVVLLATRLNGAPIPDDASGRTQPMAGARNAVHRVEIEVEDFRDAKRKPLPQAPARILESFFARPPNNLTVLNYRRHTPTSPSNPECAVPG